MATSRTDLRSALAIGLGAISIAVASSAISVVRSRDAMRTRALPVQVRMIESRMDGSTPIVRFRYEAGGVEHESTKVAALAWRGDEQAAQALVTRCTVGGSCLGFVDPDAGGNAFLDLRGFPWDAHAALLVGVAMFAAALVVLPMGPARWAIAATVWIAGGVATLFHYLTASDAYDAFLLVASAIVLVGGAPLLLRWRG